MTMNCPICDTPIEGKQVTCPACGFKLVESTQQFAPLGAAAEQHEDPVVRLASMIPDPSEPSSNDPVATLTVIRGENIGMVYTLDQHTVIGRNPGSDILLNDMTVSREHATIDRQPNGYRISDSNSYNGVWVNDQIVESTVLKSGDVIQFGAFSLEFIEEKK